MPTILEIEDLPIRITESGRWLHGTVPLHPRVAKLFARSVVPDDAGYHLEVGRSRGSLEVADTAFFVTSTDLDEAPDGALRAVRITVSDGRAEPLDGATLMSSTENVFYCRVTRHGFSVPCRFPPSLYHRLALHVEAQGDGYVLPVGADRHPIGPYDPAPHRL